MIKQIKIYETGKMSGLTYEQMNTWRKELKKLLLDYESYYDVELTVINPVDFYNFEEKLYQSHKEVMQYDLSHVKSSDIIIVNLDGLDSSIRTCIELYEAYKNEIPVIALGTQEMYDNLHPWIKEYITRVEKTSKDIGEYLSDFYFI